MIHIKYRLLCLWYVLTQSNVIIVYGEKNNGVVSSGNVFNTNLTVVDDIEMLQDAIDNI